MIVQVLPPVRERIDAALDPAADAGGMRLVCGTGLVVPA